MKLTSAFTGSVCVYVNDVRVCVRHPGGPDSKAGQGQVSGYGAAGPL